MLIMKRLAFLLVLFVSACGSSTNWTCNGDCENGTGTKHWKDGGTENGSWTNGKLNGKGIKFFGENSDFSRDAYEGEFKDDLYDGYGTYYDYSEDSRYTGQWKNGKPHGKGKATWGEKSKFPNRYYEGEWKDGLMHGMGTKFWGQAEVEEYTNNKYTGEWTTNEMHGFGKYEWADSSYYEGYWKNGEQYGDGIYVFANGEIFKGTWVDGYSEELAKKLEL